MNNHNVIFSKIHLLECQNDIRLQKFKKQSTKNKQKQIQKTNQRKHQNYILKLPINRPSGPILLIRILSLGIQRYQAELQAMYVKGASSTRLVTMNQKSRWRG